MDVTKMEINLTYLIENWFYKQYLSERLTVLEKCRLRKGFRRKRCKIINGYVALESFFNS